MAKYIKTSEKDWYEEVSTNPDNSDCNAEFIPPVITEKEISDDIKTKLNDIYDTAINKNETSVYELLIAYIDITSKYTTGLINIRIDGTYNQIRI